MKLSIVLAIFPLISFIRFSYAQFTSGNLIYVKINETAEIPLPAVANYRRTVLNAKYVEEEHLYRVCNGKNKAKCGFWENVKTKKKVASGPTTYNKNKKALLVKKIRESDIGTYMTGNKKKSFEVLKFNLKG